MSRHLTVTSICPIPYVDFQSFFSVLTQISPVAPTFGWKIFVANQPGKLRLAQRPVKSQKSVTFWRSSGELVRKFELDAKVSSCVWRALFPTEQEA